LEDTGFTLEGRVLCPDEACIGVIGPDRRCKVCGAEYKGDEPIGEEATAASPSSTADAEPAETSGDESELRPSATPDPNERVCCSDEACVGIIGPDGKCGTCGKPA
jgi:hypothetical protein